ncbi:MAG: hypothetical protein ACYS4W_01595 [Planctomycetota bacterium]|jgi:multisubunit Na+/H+ antiporter MnhB subunit
MNKNYPILKIAVALFVFIGFWFAFHRFITAPPPPKTADLALVLCFTATISIFAIYYAFIHKTTEDYPKRILNWRQLFVIAMTVLLIAYRVYFAYEDVERGLRDENAIISNCSTWVLCMAIIGAVVAFRLRDKQSHAKDRKS